MLKRLVKQFSKDNIFVIILILLAFLPRVYRLDKFPPGIIHDELNYVLNAKSLFHTGQNIPLTASAILSWGETNYDVVISELPSYIISIWIGLTKLSLFTARLPYVLISTLSVVLLYLITSKLLGKTIAKYSSLVFAFNPWSIHLGRSALEVNFATFFFLLSFYTILIASPNKILTALIFFVAMFLSYLGAKLLFLPLILILLAYRYFDSKTSHNDRKKYLLFAGLSVIVLFSYVLTLGNQPSGTRRVELILFERDWAENLVNKERLQAIPNLGLELFSNKATVILRRIVDVYLSAFSSIGLFARGETISIYSIWEYGQFHYIDFFLILAGIVYLYKLNRKVFWLLVAIILVSPTVASIDLVERTYAIRAYPMFPIFCILSGIGIWYFKAKFNFKKIATILVSIIYISSILYFLNLYFYRFPIYASERYFLSERIIANYVMRAEDNPEIKKIYVSTNESPKIVLEEYLFFSGLYDKKESIIAVNKNINNHDFSFGKVTYTNDCPEDFVLEDGNILISHHTSKCSKEESGKRGIVDLKDAGTVYYIDNDKLCKGLNLQRYYRPMDISVFDLEMQEVSEFCRNWIVSF